MGVSHLVVLYVFTCSSIHIPTSYFCLLSGWKSSIYLYCVIFVEKQFSVFSFALFGIKARCLPIPWLTLLCYFYKKIRNNSPLDENHAKIRWGWTAQFIWELLPIWKILIPAPVFLYVSIFSQSTWKPLFPFLLHRLLPPHLLPL